MNEWTLHTLDLLNFKSYKQSLFTFSPRINCIVGKNGAGKTNILDAIYYLSTGKSYFVSTDAQTIHHNEQMMSVEGIYHHDDEDERIHVGLEKGQRKKIRRNGEVYKRMADHVGLIPVVIISPSDRDLIVEGSEARRKFLDATISQTDTSYLDHLIQYHKTLKQRNTMLRNGMGTDASLRAIYDEQMVYHGSKIYQKRHAFCAVFSPEVTSHYNAISDGAEQVTFAYKSKVNIDNYAEQLKEALAKDLAMEHTTFGVHKDDLAFDMNGRLIKRFGSQGQQKTYLIALKLAQYHYLNEHKGFRPILLLDDIFDKLDAERVHRIIERVNQGVFGQIFITDTHPERAIAIAAEEGVEANIIHVNPNE